MLWDFDSCESKSQQNYNFSALLPYQKNLKQTEASNHVILRMNRVESILECKKYHKLIHYQKQIHIGTPYGGYCKKNAGTMFFSGRYSVLYRTFKRAIGKNLNCHFKEVVSAISFFVSKYSSHIYYILDGLLTVQMKSN